MIGHSFENEHGCGVEDLALEPPGRQHRQQAGPVLLVDLELGHHPLGGHHPAHAPVAQLPVALDVSLYAVESPA